MAQEIPMNSKRNAFLSSAFFSRLRLDYRHHQIGLGLSGVGLIIALTTIAIAPTIATLNCQRQADYYSRCTVTNRSLIGIPLRQVRFDPLTGAQARPESRIPGWTNRVMLYKSGGNEIPFMTFSTDALTVQRSVTQINAFLGNPKIRDFRYTQLVPWQVLLGVLTGAMILLGAGLMLLQIQ
ncbi:MAG: hypothetical protein ACO31I_04470 [Prochlorotrichaceae cyanobacterium]